MTRKPPDLEFYISDPLHGRRSIAWRFTGPIPRSIRRIERVIVYSMYALFAYCFSALLWASPTRSDGYPYRLQVNLVVLSRSVYLPAWGFYLFCAAFGVVLVLASTVLLLFWRHRAELTEVMPKNPGSEASPRQPTGSGKFHGRGTV